MGSRVRNRNNGSWSKNKGTMTRETEAPHQLRIMLPPTCSSFSSWDTTMQWKRPRANQMNETRCILCSVCLLHSVGWIIPQCSNHRSSYSYSTPPSANRLVDQFRLKLSRSCSLSDHPSLWSQVNVLPNGFIAFLQGSAMTTTRWMGLGPTTTSRKYATTLYFWNPRSEWLQRERLFWGDLEEDLKRFRFHDVPLSRKNLWHSKGT